MLNALKKCFTNAFKFIFHKIRLKNKKEFNDSKINAHQEASFGFLLNMYNNVNMYNINVNGGTKNKKIIELEEMKRQIEHYLIYGDINEVKEINTLR